MEHFLLLGSAASDGAVNAYVESCEQVGRGITFADASDPVFDIRASDGVLERQAAELGTGSRVCCCSLTKVIIEPARC